MVGYEIVESHCPNCKKITKCELEITGCMSANLKCQECGKVWREEADF